MTPEEVERLQTFLRGLSDSARGLEKMLGEIETTMREAEIGPHAESQAGIAREAAECARKSLTALGFSLGSYKAAMEKKTAPK